MLTHSEWGTPIVPVVEADKTIRICGDYKSTVNRHIINVKYLLPRNDDVFNKLNGGITFAKLDMKSAYMQLELDEESQGITTWSTHKGFFKVKILPFGIKPASAIFQRTIEQLNKFREAGLT